MGSVKRGTTIIITRDQELLGQFTSHRKVLLPRYFIREMLLHMLAQLFCAITYCMSEASLRVSPSDGDTDHYIIITKLLILVLTYDKNQNRHTGEPVEHAWLFFHTVTY
jgi:hypothetical protein